MLTVAKHHKRRIGLPRVLPKSLYSGMKQHKFVVSWSGVWKPRIEAWAGLHSLQRSQGESIPQHPVGSSSPGQVFGLQLPPTLCVSVSAFITLPFLSVRIGSPQPRMISSHLNHNHEDLLPEDHHHPRSLQCNF